MEYWVSLFSTLLGHSTWGTFGDISMALSYLLFPDPGLLWIEKFCCLHSSPILPLKTAPNLFYNSNLPQTQGEKRLSLNKSLLRKHVLFMKSKPFSALTTPCAYSNIQTAAWGGNQRRGVSLVAALSQ